MDRSATDDSHEMVQITGVHRMGSHILVADGGVHRMGSRIFVADGGVHESGLLYFYAARTVHNPGYSPFGCRVPGVHHTSQVTSFCSTIIPLCSKDTGFTIQFEKKRKDVTK